MAPGQDVYVAASDSDLRLDKARADFVCTGADDQAVIQAACAEAARRGLGVELSAGMFAMGGGPVGADGVPVRGATGIRPYARIERRSTVLGPMPVTGPSVPVSPLDLIGQWTGVSTIPVIPTTGR